MKMQKVTDAAFGVYGRVLEGYDVEPLLKAMCHTPLPEDEVLYIASEEELEELAVAKQFQNQAFGGLPIEVGFCNGHNHTLNALEYHRSSEINVAVTDMILLVGRQQDITGDYHYDTAKVEAFFVPAGTVVEMYATTLHYAPCMTEGKGFRCTVILPRGTNAELGETGSREGEGKLLAAKNKWLIAHEEAGIEGAFCGLVGENVTV
ncbi:MAG: DUF4867 family protein [Lachnospiraceae bacterium]